MFDVDRGYEAHVANLYYQAFEAQEEQCCKNCRYYDGKYCERILDDIPEEETDLSPADKDEDDWCDHWSVDDSYPDYLDGD